MQEMKNASLTSDGEQAGRKARRIAFFGGSFDPPHRGHLAVARAARAALGLDCVLFAPVGAQPLKAGSAAAGFEDRLAMTRLAIAGEPGFEISLADAPRPAGEPNFTLETLAGLRAELRPECALYCLMGADSFMGLRSWHRAAEIPFVAPLIVASRPGQRPGEWMSGLKAALPAGLALESVEEEKRIEGGVEVWVYMLANAAGERAPFYLLPGLDVEISASEIRTGIRTGIRAQVFGASEGALLPEAVAEYIRAHGLYR
jgi:nicotinate-nucleotide adenylyltransferase